MNMPATDTAVTDLEMAICLRASLGAAGLDRIEPGWFTPDRINLLTLNVGDAYTCPIGQVFKDSGGWSHVDNVMRLIDPEHGSEWGFASPSSLYRHGFDASAGSEVTMLNDAWIREILTRRNSREAMTPA